MVPVNLKLSNFTSYGENPPELDFTKFKMAAISGPNGAGKSSLLDAITWCLWGSSRAGDSSDQLVHLGASSMNVEFSFELDKHEFIVKRIRNLKSGGSTSLEFWSGSHNLTEGTIKMTQEKIITTLHLSFETFTNSAFLRQGHADEFTTHGPTDRKRILADILGLDHYDKLEEKAKEKIKEVQTKLQLLEYQLLEIEAELSQKEDNQAKKILAEKKITEIEGKIEILEKELKSLSQEKATLAATLEQHQKLTQTLTALQSELTDILTQGKNRAEKIKELEESLVKLPLLDEKLAQLKTLEKHKEEYLIALQKKLEMENALSQVKSQLALKNQEKQTLEEKLTEIKTHLESLKKDAARCPTCKQLIDLDQKQKVKTEYLLEVEKIKQQLSQIKTAAEEKEIEKIQSEINFIKLDPQKHQQIIKDLNELSSLQKKKERLIAAQATLESEKKVVLELRGLFSSKKTQIDKLEKEVKSLPNLDSHLNLLQKQIAEKEINLSSLRGEEKETRNTLGQVFQLISRQKQLENLFITRKEERQALEKEKQVFEELALAFGKKGIQAMIIEAAIPEIEDEANRLLERLTEGRMKIRLETQRETKTKVTTIEGAKERATVETLDIIISDEMGEREYELYSGGEAFRVNFALRLAISKLLTNRAGAKLQFLVIDEGFGTQDAQGRSRIVEVIDSIKDDFEKILIITH
ncbi:SMC family ATPase, partial [Candidatus Daviesbacteria bacterium]|nr:SMC family ATPase [Candidatus Daviesbacteria bacterium]